MLPLLEIPAHGEYRSSRRPSSNEGIKSAGFKAIVKSVASGKSWIKVSCAYRIGDNAATHFQAFLHELGPDRMFWASDSPFVGHEGELSYADTINWLAEQVSDAEEARRKPSPGENALQFLLPSNNSNLRRY